MEAIPFARNKIWVTGKEATQMRRWREEGHSLNAIVEKSGRHRKTVLRHLRGTQSKWGRRGI